MRVIDPSDGPRGAAPVGTSPAALSMARWHLPLALPIPTLTALMLVAVAAGMGAAAELERKRPVAEEYLAVRGPPTGMCSSSSRRPLRMASSLATWSARAECGSPSIAQTIGSLTAVPPAKRTRPPHWRGGRDRMTSVGVRGVAPWRA